MKIGFTGTRRGMTNAQRFTLGGLLVFDLCTKPLHFHHGACKGADVEATMLVRQLDPDVYVVAHPGRSAMGGDDEWLDRRVVELSNEVRCVRTHFASNRDIVDETDELIACPCDMIEQPKGGTWYTIRYAWKRRKKVTIVWPDGSLGRPTMSTDDSTTAPAGADRRCDLIGDGRPCERRSDW